MSVYEKENPVFLRKSIDSMLMQSVKPDEIVVVKDGRLTPELDGLIDEYRENHSIIKLVAIEENAGLWKALRTGVEHCSYDLVARMDADDISAPCRCELQLLAFESDPNLDMVGGQIIEFEDEGPQDSDDKSLRKVPISGNEISFFAKSRNPFNHMTVMFKKEAVLKAGNYQEMPMFEDYFLWVRMLMAGCRMMNLDEVLVYARRGNGIYSRRGGVSYVRSIIRCQKAFLSLGFISLPQFVRNMAVRVPVALVPNVMRKRFYEWFLRTK
jgi:glycosyltransferase involved in cell wall biosynthesis